MLAWALWYIAGTTCDLHKASLMVPKASTTHGQVLFFHWHQSHLYEDGLVWTNESWRAVFTIEKSNNGITRCQYLLGQGLPDSPWTINSEGLWRRLPIDVGMLRRIRSSLSCWVYITSKLFSFRHDYLDIVSYRWAKQNKYCKISISNGMNGAFCFILFCPVRHLTCLGKWN